MPDVAMALSRSRQARAAAAVVGLTALGVLFAWTAGFPWATSAWLGPLAIWALIAAEVALATARSARRDNREWIEALAPRMAEVCRRRPDVRAFRAHFTAVPRPFRRWPWRWPWARLVKLTPLQEVPARHRWLNGEGR